MQNPEPQPCHPREGGDPTPEGPTNIEGGRWVPAFAGMTKKGSGNATPLELFAKPELRDECGVTIDVDAL
jgi:hypothetical protein